MTGAADNDSSGPPEARSPVPAALALQTALDRYERAGSPAALDVAFAAAARAVAERRGERANEPPEVTELERLFDEVPDYERLVNIAVGETERSVEAAGARLWEWFGLESTAPTWNEGERSRARLLVACACAPLDEQVVKWLGPRLLRLSADRWAALLTADLRRADEDLWRRVLGERTSRFGGGARRAAGGAPASSPTCSPGTTRPRRPCSAGCRAGSPTAPT